MCDTYEHRGTKARYTFNSSGVYYGLCTVLLYKAIGCDLRYPLDACGYHKLEDSTEEYPIRADHCTISVDLDIKTTFFYAGQPASVRSNSNRTLICRKEQWKKKIRKKDMIQKPDRKAPQHRTPKKQRKPR
ncbi:hypothetical protein Pdw03_8379 [Penicillium digitatum]|uniref:Uncharacterized protein n=1 Tax=Penicillium digitatum TaxID=36651 RepID=A0A7T6XNF1_PENDI|nr:hypothetical protein Pdw03_8379 [Penicillium digitatum]